MLTLTFEQRLPTDVPDTLPVYGALPPPTAADAMRAIARNWPGVGPAHTADRKRQVQDWSSADIGQLRLIYNRLSGAVQADVRRGGTHVSKGSERFLSETDRVVERARAFLNRSRFVDEEVSNLQVGKITHLRQQSASREGPARPPEILDAGVVFTRVIGKTAVVGPGGHAMVKVLPDGTIAGASRVLRRRGAESGTARILSPADALAELERRLRRDRGLDERVRVLRAQFGYFEAGRSQRQRFFEPVYAFVYATEDSFPLKSALVIAASRSPREAWGHDSRKLLV